MKKPINPKKMSTLVKICIVATGLLFVAMCAYWFLLFVLFSSFGSFPDSLFFAKLIFFVICALPPFYLMAKGWGVADQIKNDNLFSLIVAATLKKCAIVLFANIAVFLAGNVVFLLLDFGDMFLIYLAICIIGILIAGFLAVLSFYVQRAARLAEEVEGTI